MHLQIRQGYLQTSFFGGWEWSISCLNLSFINMYKNSKEPQYQGHPLSPRASPPMLSQFRIQLPKPQPTKKTISHQQISQNIQSHKYPEPELNYFKVDSHQALFSGTRTKNSSASLPFRTESQIISEWIRNLFQKKGLLGPQWQQKLIRKKKEMLRYAFNVVREFQPRQSSGCLQTQSRHKPYLRSLNHLHALGLQKMSEVTPRLLNKIKQNAFSRILQFLAFKNVKATTNNNTLNNSIANSLRTSSRDQPQPRLVLNFASRQQYDILTTSFKPIKQVQSNKNIPRIQNQYALSPVFPFTQGQIINQQEQKIRTPRSSRSQQMSCSHGMVSSRDLSRNNQIQNRAMYDPRFELIKLKESQYIHSNNNPPSPNSHRIAMANPIQQKINPQNHINNQIRHQHPRPSTRPHTHHPFPTTHHSKQKQPPKHEPYMQPESRSRAVSASHSIKISFMNNYPFPAPRKDVPHDYQGEHHQHQNSGKAKNIYKLGTVQNKQMRQSYQMNSFNNELIPQDYPRIPNLFFSPNTQMCSSPVTPKVIHSPTSKGIFLSPPTTASSPYQAHSPVGIHQIGRPGHRTHKNPENKRFPNPYQVQNDYNFRKREKLVVTSSRRKH